MNRINRCAKIVAVLLLACAAACGVQALSSQDSTDSQNSTYTNSQDSTYSGEYGTTVPPLKQDAGGIADALAELRLEKWGAVYDAVDDKSYSYEDKAKDLETLKTMVKKHGLEGIRKGRKDENHTPMPNQDDNKQQEASLDYAENYLLLVWCKLCLGFPLNRTLLPRRVVRKLATLAPEEKDDEEEDGEEENGEEENENLAARDILAVSRELNRIFKQQKDLFEERNEKLCQHKCANIEKARHLKRKKEEYEAAKTGVDDEYRNEQKKLKRRHSKARNKLRGEYSEVASQ